jgi:hypothetical protein
LTRSNDAVDYFLHDGDSLPLRPREVLWISVDADEPARLLFRLAGGSGSRVVDAFRDWWQHGRVGAFGAARLGMRIG